MAEERVNYDDIEDEVNNLKDIAQRLEETNQKIETELNGLNGEWKGDASNKYKSAVSEFLNQGSYLKQAPQTIASAGLFLMSVSGAYQDAENETIKKTKSELLGFLGGEEALNKMDVSSLPDVDLSARVADQYPDDSDEKPATEEPGTEGPNTSTSPGTVTNNSGGGGSSSGGGGSSSSGGGTSSATSKSNTDKSKKSSVSSLQEGQKIKDLDKLNQDNQKSSAYTTEKYETGSSEASVEEVWKKQGSNYKNDIAIVNDANGEERYLVKVSSTYGKVGDTVDLKLSDNSTLKCVIAETENVGSTSTEASSVLSNNSDNASTTGESIYGTQTESGKINVIEFKTNSEAENIKYPFEENNKVTEVSNKGNNIISK